MTRTPLRFYILYEAAQNNGQLGEVGGTLVAGTILSLTLRGRGKHTSGLQQLPEIAEEPARLSIEGLGGVTLSDMVTSVGDP